MIVFSLGWLLLGIIIDIEVIMHPDQYNRFDIPIIIASNAMVIATILLIIVAIYKRKKYKKMGLTSEEIKKRMYRDFGVK